MTNSNFILSWNDSSFLLNGKPFQIFSGEIHYQRIPKEYWRHRLQMAKAMGLNTVAIYMFWNQHEPKPGSFSFKGRNNVKKFIQMAQEEELWVIIRPGPYCCAEWDFGGLPQWLLADNNIRVRTMNEYYIQAVEKYVKRWSHELLDLQSTKGGPILMVQVENEYGSYGSDKNYLNFLKNLLEEVGFEIPKFTCDGWNNSYLLGGTLPDLLPMVNFGNNPQIAFRNLKNFRGNIPHMCCEYYPGWFNHWGDKKLKNTSIIRINQIVTDLKWMLENNKSWNLYMFHGGTNFGFSAGANYHGERYQPDITSYDYSAPLSESGRPNEQYRRYRKLMTEFQMNGEKLKDIPKENKRIESDIIKFKESAPLFKNLPKPVECGQIHSMEYYGLNNGLINYRTKLYKAYIGRNLIIRELHDYGHIFINGEKIATLSRLNKKDGTFKVKIPEFLGEYGQLDILVESLGRINYGSNILDRKGITEFVSINETPVLMNWQVFLIDLTEPYFNSLKFHNEIVKFPAFHRGFFKLEKNNIGDTFLDARLWKKGMVWINQHNLGRFWELGPQFSLYIPGPWLHEGENEILIFDMEGSKSKKFQKKILKKVWNESNFQIHLTDYKRPAMKGLKEPIK